MSIKRKIFYALYYIIFWHIPSLKNSSKGFLQRIRSRVVSGFIDYCGFDVNIQHKARIARRVRVGSYSGIGARSLIQGGVVIGEHVMMGPEVYIYTQNHNFERTDVPMDSQGFAGERPVIIGDDVWIGARVTILGGVTVGKGSIIGTGSVVTKDIPEYSVVVGNPAKIVKNRQVTK